MNAHGEERRWELARTVRAAGEARAHVDAYRDELGEDIWRRARLLVSELATNAFRHGAGRIHLLVLVSDARIRVCVEDEGSGELVTRTPGVDGGFGLHLVADLSDRWGADHPAAVWFEIDQRAAA